jgi:hypothetical protein
VGERCVWWAGFRAECLGWRRVNSWGDGWLKGWESRVAGFGWSGLQLVPPTPLAQADLTGSRFAPWYCLNLRSRFAPTRFALWYCLTLPR